MLSRRVEVFGRIYIIQIIFFRYRKKENPYSHNTPHGAHPDQHGHHNDHNHDHRRQGNLCQASDVPENNSQFMCVRQRCSMIVLLHLSLFSV